jgi:nitric oxide reductase NorQ protein
MPRGDKHGHAIYLEFRDTVSKTNPQVAQFIITGYGASGMEVVPYRMLARTISNENPQRSFRHDAVSPDPDRVKALNGSLQRLARPQGGFILARDVWAELVGSIDIIALGGWKLVGRPLVTQVSQLDLQALKSNARPKLLIDRINRVRVAAGLPRSPLEGGNMPDRLVQPGPMDKDLNDAYNDAVSDSNYSVIARMESVHESLPELLLLLGGSAISQDAFDLLDTWVDEGGKLEGQSKRVPEEDELDTEEAPEDKYIRPNGEYYYARDWSGFQDVLALRKARENNLYPLLYGPPGTGKTALVEAAFDDLITVVLSGDTEAMDLVGQFMPDPTGESTTGYIWVDGPLIQAMEEGRGLLLDEVGLPDSKVLAVAYGAMDGRRELVVSQNPARGTIKAKDGFFIVGATNPNAPGVHMSEALLSRFTLHVEVTTDWVLAVTKLNVPDTICTIAENLSKKVELGELDWAPQMRELLAFRDAAKVFNEDFAVKNLIAVAPEGDREAVQEAVKRMYGATAMAARI